MVRDFYVVLDTPISVRVVPEHCGCPDLQGCQILFLGIPKIGDPHADWELSYADHSWCICWATLLLSGLNAAL
jgi:hypothetical protein